MLALALSSCAVSPAAQTNDPGVDEAYAGNVGTFYASWVSLGDGTEVRCVVWIGTNKGGPSCDWSRVRKISR